MREKVRGVQTFAR